MRCRAPLPATPGSHPGIPPPPAKGLWGPLCLGVRGAKPSTFDLPPEGPKSQHRHLSRDLQLEIRAGLTQGPVSLPKHRDSRRRRHTGCPLPHLSNLLQSHPRVGKVWGTSSTPAAARASGHRQALSDTCQPQAPWGSGTRTVGSPGGNWGGLTERMECTPHSPKLQGCSACPRLPYARRQTHKPLTHTLLHALTPPLGQSPHSSNCCNPTTGHARGFPWAARTPIFPQNPTPRLLGLTG